MLPTPVSYSNGRYGERPFKFDRAFLVSRSRVTNLGIVILAFILLVSLLVNIRLTLFNHPTVRTWREGLRSGRVSAPTSIRSTIVRDPELTELTHLVIVAGHAVWVGCDANKRSEEDEWLLEAHQKNGRNVEAFVSHIERGVDLLHQDPSSLLIFSGGQTRAHAPMTEGESYHRLATEMQLLDRNDGSRSSRASKRVATENFALDSYQNLLFSVARFHEVTGAFPKHITVVGFGMKKRRFQDLHRSALRWPLGQFSYVGVDVPGDTSDAYKGESQFGYLPYSKDLYGCHGELLAKRLRRNPFSIFHPYYTSVPEMADLMDWCPEKHNALFNGKLPWHQ